MPTTPICPACGLALSTEDGATCTRCSSAAEPGPTATLSLDGNDAPQSLSHSNINQAVTATTTGPVTYPANVTREEIFTRVGRFEVQELVGEGAFGDVYKAHDPQLDRNVALKVAKPGSLGTATRARRFLREAKAAANLRHPHIVPLYETGEDTGRYFIVSAFIEGQTLAAVIDANPQGLPASEAAVIARKLAGALAYAHSEGVIHRDVKPDNIMVDQKGEPHLLDFGLAARDEAGDEKLTQAGAVLGSPAYMSPEQARGDVVGPEADQYSLGCTLYELLTGRTPFAGPREVQLLLHQTKEPAAARSINPSIPLDLDTIVMKCLEKDFNRRYPSCRAVADDLRRWMDGEPITARRIGTAERLTRWARRNPGLACAVTAAMVLLAIGASVSSYFAVEANARAVEAREHAARADAETQKVRSARDDASREAARAVDAEERAKNEAAEARRQQVAADLSRSEAERATYFAQIGRADSLLLAGRGASASVVLESTRWDLRGWEYGYLKQQSEPSPMTLRGHQGGVWSVRFGRDGQKVMSGSSDGTVRIWSIRNGAEIKTIQTGHTSEVRMASFSNDDSHIVTGSWDGTAKLFRTDSGELVTTLLGHRLAIVDAQFSPDGSEIATASDDGTIRLWSISGGPAKMVWRAPGAIRQLARTATYSHDGRMIGTAFADGSVWIWERKTGEVRKQVVHGRSANTICFSPDGRRFATTSYERNAKIWDLASGKEQITISGHTGDIGDVAFSPDGANLVTGSEDRTVRVWDVATGQQLGISPELAGGVTSVRFSYDGEWVAAASGDHTIRIWPSSMQNRSQSIKAHTYEISSICYSPDGKKFITSSVDKTATIWDAATGTRALTLNAQTGRARVVQYSPNGRHVAVSDEQFVRVYDDSNGLVQSILMGHRASVVGVSFSPDGARIATGSEDGTVRIWDAKTGKEILQMTDHKTWVYGVCFSPDGSKVVSGSGDKTARVWDAVTGQSLKILEGHTSFVWSIRFSPDSRQLATAAWDGTVKLWDTSTWKEIRTLRGHTGKIFGLSFHPDGSRLASAGGDDSMVKIWDTSTGQELCSIKPSTEQCRSVVFSPDGNRILIGTEGGSLIIADGRFENVVLSIRRPVSILSAKFSSAGNSFEITGIDHKSEIFDLPSIISSASCPPVVHGEIASSDGRFELRVRGSTVSLLARSPLTLGFDSWVDVEARYRSLSASWHRDKVAEAESRNDWFAAAFHQEQLLIRNPFDALSHLRLVQLLSLAEQPQRAALYASSLLLLPLYRPATLRDLERLTRQIDPITERRIQDGSGLITSKFAFVQDSPVEELSRLASDLNEAGYRIVRIRPYSIGTGAFVAALWIRDGIESRFLTDASSRDLRIEDQSLRKLGFQPSDVAAWLDYRPYHYQPLPIAAVLGCAARVRSSQPVVRYAAVWEPAIDGRPSSDMHVAVPASRFNVVVQPSINSGFGPRSLHELWLPKLGDYYSSVWSPTRSKWSITWKSSESDYMNEDREGLKVVEVTEAISENGQPQFAAIWHGMPNVEVKRLTNLTPSNHLTQMRQLAAEGWYPVSLAVVEKPPSQRLVLLGQAHAAAMGWASVKTSRSFLTINHPSEVLSSSVWHRIITHPATAASQTKSPETLYQQGRVLEARNDQDGAIRAYHDAIRSGIKEHRAFTRLATLLHAKGDYSAALQVLRDGASVNPTWLTDISTSFRYNMACLACLTAARPNVAEGEQIKLRNEALGWLRADLAAWQKLATNQSRTLVVEKMAEWLKDTDFDSVRDPNKLTVAEREGWTRLWDEVRALQVTQRPRTPLPLEAAPSPRALPAGK